MKKFLLVVVACFAMSSVFLLPKSTYAEQSGWLTTSLTGEIDEQPANYAPYGDCTTIPVQLGTYYYPGTLQKSVCVYKSEQYSYFMDGGYLYVSLPGDPTFYLVNNVNFSNSGFILPSPDTNDFVYWAQVVTDLPNKLTATAYGQTKIYNFDESQRFLYNFAQDELGSLGYTLQGTALSHNGKWLVARLRGVGIVRFNVEDKTAMRISNTSDGFSMLAVSNDGLYVAEGLTGNDSQPVIYDLHACGQNASILQSAWMSAAMTNPCASRTLSTEVNELLHVGYSKILEKPDFSNDGGQLTLYALRDNKQVKVTLQSTTYEPFRLDYLALGDSYSSGEGDIGVRLGGNFYIDGTQGDKECHLSYRSYPYLLRDYWKIDSSKMRSVACSGAKILPDFYGGGLYYGQNRQLLSSGNEKRTSEQESALGSFKPGVIRQIEFVKEYKPKILTLTGGGNDVGFADIIGYCATSYIPFTDETCGYVGGQMAADLRRTIDDQYGYTKTFIEKIKQASANTKIYIIGYPQFVSDGYFCKENSFLLNKAERQAIRSALSRLNNTLKKVAHDTNVYYVDIENSLSGGQICEGSRYMTGPVRSFARNLKTRDPNMYHPNDLGHQMMAQEISRRIESGMNYEILEISNETTGRRVQSIAVMLNYAGVGSSITIGVEPGTYKAGTLVREDMFSEPTELGNSAAKQDGSLRVNLTIPHDIGYGLHLITLTGIDNDNQPLVSSGYINIISQNENDVDGDGVSDDIDRCFAVAEWYLEENNLCVEPVKQAKRENSSLFEKIQPKIANANTGGIYRGSVDSFTKTKLLAVTNPTGNDVNKKSIEQWSFWILSTILFLGLILIRLLTRKVKS